MLNTPSPTKPKPQLCKPPVSFLYFCVAKQQKMRELGIETIAQRPHQPRDMQRRVYIDK